MKIDQQELINAYRKSLGKHHAGKDVSDAEHRASRIASEFSEDDLRLATILRACYERTNPTKTPKESVTTGGGAA